VNAAENKELVQEIFAELAKGNARPFVGHMANDFSWTVTGTTKWSRTYAGKEVVVRELFGALGELLTAPITTIGHRFIADGDYVVVEAHGKNTTKDRVPYNNSYCFVIRMADGKLQELTEYLDTQMVTTVLGERVNPGATLSS
jgi:ketosteroid isomerase-like protein